MNASLSWVEISKSALIHNVKQFRKVAGTASLMAVVKSNAYGHDSMLVSKVLQPYVDWFGTANLSEALELRANKIRKPILVLNYYGLGQVGPAVKENISLVVYDLKQARAISQAAISLKKKAKIHIKVGTGLTRLGVLAVNALDFVSMCKALPNLKPEGIFSHFAASEDDPDYTLTQLSRFRQIIAELESNNIFIPIKHIACTASALAFPESRLDLVRIGIGIYGLQSYKSIQTKVRKVNPGFNLKPALSWKTKILAVKELPAGVSIGYGRTFKTTRKTKLAILPVGYYEGYDRKLSNLGEVLIKGKRCKVLGRVYMNLLSVDASDVKNVKASDKCILIGSQGKESVTADELGQKLGTINYEIVTRINPLLPRVLVK